MPKPPSSQASVTIETLSHSARELYDRLRPGSWTGTARTADLRAVLLATDGWTFYCGSAYDIKSERIGPGVYRVWLKKREY